MKETIEERIDRLIEQTASSATTTADIAQYKKRIGAKGTSKESSLVLRVTGDKDKLFDWLKNLVKKYQDRGVTINSGLDSKDEGVVEIVAPVHLVDEIKQKVEKRKGIEVQ